MREEVVVCYEDSEGVGGGGRQSGKQAQVVVAQVQQRQAVQVLEGRDVLEFAVAQVQHLRNSLITAWICFGITHFNDTHVIQPPETSGCTEANIIPRT